MRRIFSTAGGQSAEGVDLLRYRLGPGARARRTVEGHQIQQLDRRLANFPQLEEHDVHTNRTNGAAGRRDGIDAGDSARAEPVPAAPSSLELKN